MQSKAPTRLGDYELLGALARGQSCVVQLARFVGAGAAPTLRALKIPVDGSASPAMLNELAGEASLLARVQHPSVVTAHGVSREQGGYLALDYIEGDDLESLLLGGAPDPRIAAAVFADVLAGLDALHNAVDPGGESLRAVHQAPYARHIVVGSDGRARLVDFSSARTARDGADSPRVNRLAMASLAPEQILAPDTIDARTDLFVLATSLWEALTGLRLFAAATPAQRPQQVLKGRVPPPSATGRSAVAAFDEVCLRALARERVQRWQSARDMRAALLEAARALGGVAEKGEVALWVSTRAANLLDVRRALAARGIPGSSEPAIVAESVSAFRSGALGKENAPLADGGASLRFRPMRPSSTRPPPASASPPPLATSPAARTSVRPSLRLATAASQPRDTQGAESVASAAEPTGPTPVADPSARPPAPSHAVLLAREPARLEESQASSAPNHAAAEQPPPARAAEPPSDSPQAHPASATQPGFARARRPADAPLPPLHTVPDRPPSSERSRVAPGPVEPPTHGSSRPTRPTSASASPADESGRPSPRQIAWMCAVVLGSVVLGEAVLRFCFHSPYGEPAPRLLDGSAMELRSESIAP